MNSYILVSGVENKNSKQKIYFEINTVQLRLGNVSKGFSVDNIKKTRLYVYDFSVDHDTADINTLDIHKYSLKKHEIK